MIIRKEVKEDGSFGGNYPYGITYHNLPENLIEVTEEQRNYIDKNLDKLRYIDGEITDISNTPEYLADQEVLNQDRENRLQRSFLSDTDWKVIRHRDQLALGVETSLTEEEYQELLELRQQAREAVSNVTSED